MADGLLVEGELGDFDFPAIGGHFRPLAVLRWMDRIGVAGRGDRRSGRGGFETRPCGEAE